MTRSAKFHDDATRDKVHQFLEDAATEGSGLRKSLEEDDGHEVARLLRDQYGIEVQPNEVPDPGERRVPSTEQCQQLLDTFEGELAASPNPPSYLAPLVLVVGYAMPLTATVEREVP
jgi:hypothetical protein